MLRRVYEMKIFLSGFLVAIFLVFSAPRARAQGPVPGNQPEALIKKSKDFHIDLPKTNPQADEAAKRLVELYRSPAFQEKLRIEREKISRMLFGMKLPRPPWKPERRDQTPTGGILPPRSHLYVMVSSSMPLKTLRNYAAAIEQLKDPACSMLLRGFVGGAGRLGPTVTFVGKVLRIDPDCDLSGGNCVFRAISFAVNPLPFLRYAITRVPAVVYVPNERAEPLIVYGDASLRYVLRLVAETDKALAPAATRLENTSF